MMNIFDLDPKVHPIPGRTWSIIEYCARTP
jgi:hypothetical protein